MFTATTTEGTVMTDKTFASIAEAVAHFLDRGFRTVRADDRCRLMQAGEAFVAIEWQGMLLVTARAVDGSDPLVADTLAAAGPMPL